VSSDPELERLLRDARETLPEPGPGASRRARARALAAMRGRRPRRLRTALVVASALVVAVALGIGVGALVAPTGTAARTLGVGFLPEPGWYALQAAAPATPTQPQVIMSANVPFAPDDAVLGEAEPSGLPYSTLLTLPPKGMVIVATFTEQDHLGLPRSYVTSTARRVPPLYPEREIPFRMSEATPFIQYGTQIRPDEPLGQYQLRASLEDWYVDVHVYFGTPRPSRGLVAEAQRQLDRMVVRQTPLGTEAQEARPATTHVPSAPGVLDRTFACRPSLAGGARKLDALARRGTGRGRTGWERPALAGVTTNISGAAATAVDNYLVWVGTGRPSAAALVPTGPFALFDFPFRVWGTIAVNRTRCSAARGRVALSRRGLVGGEAGVFPDEFDCTTPSVVLVRVRAVTESRTVLRSYRNFVRTVVPVKEASIAVQTRAGKRLAFAQLAESGQSRIFVAQPPCFPG
jgi:hypothetical protein